MANKTISITFSRDELCKNGRSQQSNEVIAAGRIFNALRAQGVPVVGVLGVLAVEWGQLTITHEDGLDGDEWTWSWTGEPMPKEWADKCGKAGAALKLDNPLRQQIADADEL